MIAILFLTQRCIDGVHEVEHGPPPRTDVTVLGKFGAFYADRSDRLAALTLTAIDLEDPIVQHFFNAFTPERATAFLSRFGHLYPGVDTLRTSFEALRLELAASTWSALSSAISEQTAALTEISRSVRLKVSAAVWGERPRLQLECRNLYEFMCMEVASAAEAGAMMQACERCERTFFTGPLTGRRSSAKFCSDRCRVAASRHRTPQG